MPSRILKRLTRQNSSDEAVNYAYRKDLISRNPHSYYPPVQTTRGGEPILRLPEFIKEYGNIDFSSFLDGKYPQTIQIEGKVKAIRRAGKAMFFLDVIQDDAKVQVCASNKLLKDVTKDEFSRIHSFIRKGDHITCVGHPSTTNVGELTLKATKPITVSSPCLNSVTIPDKLIDRKLINKNRVMNYIVDPELRQRIKVKGAITKAIRDFLHNDGFLEVQTPILAGNGTGANAEPFQTKLKAISDEKLLLRVAPELWLKKLVIGGFDKVFEIGSNFRNEGIDSTHNPEFLTCEFYRSFTSLPELMKMTEDMFSFIHSQLLNHETSSTFLRERLRKLSSFQEGNFPKFEFIPTIESRTGHQMPVNFTTEALLEYYKKIGVKLPENKSPASLLDNLSAIYLESLSVDKPDVPIFIYNQPSVMSPLAKSRGVVYGDRCYDISLRFELFINGR
ncbi:amino acid--tRNA ligase-related protein, partial [Staphylococcus epidermidis]